MSLELWKMLTDTHEIFKHFAAVEKLYILLLPKTKQLIFETHACEYKSIR